MSLWLKIAGGVVLAAAAVAVGIFAFGLGKPQLTSLVNTGEEANRTKPGSQAGQSRANSTKLDWEVNCKGDRGELGCLAVHSVRGKKTGRVILSAEVKTSRGSKQPYLRLKLPLNVYLPAGVRLRIGSEPVKALKIQTCTRSGCTAASRITENELAAMLKGEKLTVSMKDADGTKPVAFQISGGGFDKAYAKLN